MPDPREPSPQAEIGDAPRAAAGVLLVRRVGLALRVATLVSEGRRSLPKAFPGPGESLEKAAQRAGEGWSGRSVRLERSVGVALLDVGGRSVAAWFHVARVGPGEPLHARASDVGAWRLEWTSIETAELELAQLEERQLVRRALRENRIGARTSAALGSALRPLADRGPAPALLASLLFALTAAWLGWLAAPTDAATELAVLVPRIVFAATLGAWTSAALRTRSARANGRRARLLESALLGGVWGSLVAAALAAGTVDAVTLGPRGVLLVAWLCGFAERLGARSDQSE